MTPAVDPEAAGPLDGVRVLDLTRLLPGNYCTLVMAALGADVIKVEDHGAGDYIRRYGTQVGGTGVIDHQVNRGKRSICLDLKDPTERGHFEALVATSQILVESFRPGTMDKLGYSADRLHELRPDLVIASINGFGAGGPLAAAHGHDLNFLALSGLLDRLGEIGGDPQPLPIPLADLLGGLVSAMFTIPYLRRAEKTGRGAVIDAPLFEALALLPSSLLAEVVAGSPVGGRGEFKLGAGLATYAVYGAKDGHVAVVAQEAHFWDGLVEVVGLQDLKDRQRDPSAQDEIRARLGAFFGARTKAEIEAAFAGRPACLSLLQSYEEMLASPHAVARGYLRTGADTDPDAAVPELALPVTVDGARPRATTRSPRQGEHTAEILAELGRSGAGQ